MGLTGRYELTLECDHELEGVRCSRVHVTVGDKRGAAVAAARREGWKVDQRGKAKWVEESGRALCPDHNPTLNSMRRFSKAKLNSHAQPHDGEDPPPVLRCIP